jgi:hypothetical protein
MHLPRTWRTTVLAATLIVGATALAGCPTPNTPTTNPSPGSSAAPSLDTTASDVQSDASNVISDLSDFETSLTQSAAELSSAADVGFGDSTVQSLSLGGGDRQIQDVTGSYTAGYPTPAGANLAAALLATGSVNAFTYTGWTPSNLATTSNVPNWMQRFPKTYQHTGNVNGQTGVVIGASTESYYVANNAPQNPQQPKSGPFAYSQTVVHDGQTVLDLFSSPDAVSTGSFATILPAPFNALQPSTGSIPTSVWVRQCTNTWFTYGSSASSAVGYRWAVHDLTDPVHRPLFAWIRAFQITRLNATKGNQTVNHYDVATNYTAQSNGQRIPYEYITDDNNVTANTKYHQDKVYNAATTTWSSTGSYTDKNGKTRTVSETWNTTTQTRTRTVSWTNAKNVAITMVMNFNADRSGAGTISASGSVIANLAWLKTGKGTMTNVSTNQTKPFTAQY